MSSSAFQSPTSPANASQAQQEAGTSTSVYVSPGVQQYHPSANKAWVNFNGTGTVAIRASYNVTSITDNTTGNYTVNFTTAFSSTNYQANVSTNAVGSGYGAYILQTTSTTQLLVDLFRVTGGSPSADDASLVMVQVAGDQ